MARSRRLPSPARPFIIVAAFVAASFLVRPSSVTHAAALADSVRITIAANVTLRAMPAAEAAAVAQLPLGTEVNEAGPAGLDKTWLRVRTRGGDEGWVQARLTRPLDPVWRWPVFDRLIGERLARTGDGFPAQAELVAFIERVAPEYTDPDGRAHIELARLRAVSGVLGSIPFGGGRREPYATWLAGRGREAVYDEPGGRWMLASAVIWSSHDQHAASAVADEIAWLAVTNGLPGECEGHLRCYLSARNQLEGEYLRRHPNGRHAATAVAAVKQTADVLLVPPGGKVAYTFDRSRDCRDVTTSVEALAAGIAGPKTGDRDAALASLGRVRDLCAGGRQPG